jgi:apolipoprotein N-acyltransferase
MNWRVSGGTSVHAPADDVLGGVDPSTSEVTEESRPPSGLARPPLWAAMALCVASGLALASAFAPVNWWPMAVPAVSLFLVAVRGQSLRRGLLLGLIAGLAEFLPLIWWVHVIGPDAWLLLAIVESFYIAVLGGALALVVGRLPGWPLWSACLFVSEELVRDRWPLGGFTWGRLAFSQADTPFTSYASVAGAPLVTFVVALSGALVAFAYVALIGVLRTGGPSGRRAIAFAAPAVVAALLLPIAGSLIPRASSGRVVQVALVQGNVPHPGMHFLGRAEQVLDYHVKEANKLVADVKAGTLKQPQLVIWPENASDVDPFTNAHAYSEIQSTVSAIGVPTLVGAVLSGPGDRVTNAGLVWSPTTGPGARYVKRHLVPFGEYIPFRSLIGSWIKETNLVPQDFAPGHTPGALKLGPVTVGDVMCFEVAFDEQVRDSVTHGGQLIVVQTNNATYMGTSETKQQLAMSQLRAVEHGRSVVVAATSGISAVIAPDGRVVTQSRELTPAIIDQPVVERSSLTLADRVGALPEWIIGGVGIMIAGYAWLNANARLSARRTAHRTRAGDGPQRPREQAS